MEYLDHETNKAMAIIIVQSVLKNNTHIATADEVSVSFLGLVSSFSILYWYGVSFYCLLQVDALFELAKGLIKDFDGAIDNEVLEFLFVNSYCICVHSILVTRKSFFSLDNWHFQTGNYVEF